MTKVTRIKRTLLTLFVLAAFIMIFSVSCMLDPYRDYYGTWVYEDGYQSSYKLIVTPQKIQLLHYEYSDASKTHVDRVLAREQKDWTVNSDGSVDYQYTTGVVLPCVFYNNFTFDMENNTILWKENYTEHGYNLNYEKVLVKESDDQSLVSGNLGYEELSNPYFMDNLGIDLYDTHLRLYYDGRFEWDNVGSGRFEHNSIAHQVTLHQEQYEELRYFGSMVLGYNPSYSDPQLGYQSSTDEFWYEWLDFFDYELSW